MSADLNDRVYLLFTSPVKAGNLRKKKAGGVLCQAGRPVLLVEGWSCIIISRSSNPLARASLRWYCQLLFHLQSRKELLST